MTTKKQGGRGTRRTTKGNDPLLTGKRWRTTIRGHWQTKREPCTRCGGPIDYDSPRYLPGTRKVNPRSLVVGHIVSRHQARTLGWSDAQINALTNTQPECAHCSDSSGATYGNQIRARTTPTTPTRPTTATRW